ncbi:MAG: DUF2203 domain-containing protein [Euryarchaeota archaeon]|nr:DUF2203 domain-containing protein [Euryarchaeota archaeon]MDE1835740.1 DUF2203 domain-containing protein [Euryarchaeota archaeon]MDE1880835.1 DUF2203 domain-containing protein [Euryarchaeota archaeon]MDE2043931.1 DUF2203 domain-containing protein [Thermoplasmata archaeon]
MTSVGEGRRSSREPEEDLRPGRFWQVPEAEEALTELAPRFRVLRVKVARMAEVLEELDRLQKVWGEEFDAPDQPDASRKHELEAQARAFELEVESELEGWKSRGIEVKDLASGLIDFYALRHGEVIFLCWRAGEEGIRFWHPLQGGYRARRPLTSRERAGGLGQVPFARGSTSGSEPIA